MPGPFHGWLTVKDRYGGVQEVFNQARTAAYLANPDITVDGIDICDVLDFGGCENYAWMPYDHTEGYVDFPSEANDNLTAPRTKLHDVYTGKGTVALGNADTGQTWLKAGTTPSIIAGKAGVAQGVGAASYWDVSLGAKVMRLGAKVTFTTAGTTNNGAAAILAWSKSASAGVPFPPDSPCHLTMSPANAQFSVWENQVNTVLWTHVFGAPLTSNDTTQYEFSVVIEGDTATTTLPGGVVIVHTDPRIASLAGTFAGYEVFQAASDHSPRYVEVWADIYSNSMDVLGDLTMVIDMAPDDWTPAVAQSPFSKFGAAAPAFSFYAYVSTGGALGLGTSPDGTALQFRTSTANLSALANGTRQKWAVTFDADNGAAGNSTRFWTTDDDEVTWVQLGATVTQAGVTALFFSNQDVLVGNYYGGIFSTTGINGKIHSVSLRRGIGVGGTVGGTEVFRFDADTDLIGVAAGATSFPVSTGQTVTVNRSGSPATTLVPPEVILGECGEGWVMPFDTPTLDPAPWYNADYPESADALGFYVEEWTGLDDRHVTRQMTRTGRDRGGASPGVISNRDRVMKLNVIMFASSEEAMSYQFHWLAALLESVCSSCASDTLLIRDYCGEIDDPLKGIRELRDVALIEGLGWEADLVQRGSCFIRRASFTLAAGDPCMYLPETAPTVVVDTANLGPGLLTTNYSLTRSPARPSCSELPADTRQAYTWASESAMGAKAPVVIFHNDDPEHAFPFRAIVYHDPGEIGVTPNPCGLGRLGEIYVRPMPPYSYLKWDVAGREVQYRDPTTGDWVESWFLIDMNDAPLQRYFALPCGGDHHLVLEPGTLAIERIGGTGNVFEWGGIIFSTPHFPSVELTIVERVSCS